MSILSSLSTDSAALALHWIHHGPMGVENISRRRPGAITQTFPARRVADVSAFDQDVVRLDVPVDTGDSMKIGQGVADLSHHAS